MSKELGEKERIKVMSEISSAPGGDTTDYVCLEAVLAGINEETEEKMKNKSNKT